MKVRVIFKQTDLDRFFMSWPHLGDKRTFLAMPWIQSSYYGWKWGGFRWFNDKKRWVQVTVG